MAHVFSINNEATTITLDLASGVIVTGVTLDTPSIESRELIPQGVDGGEIESLAYRNVTSTLDLLIVHTTTAGLQGIVNDIEDMLADAHRRQKTGTGGRVYLQVQVDGEASTWRTEILIGRLRIDNALDQWSSKKIEGQLIITRRFYWEGPEKELQLSASTQSAATGGRTVYNHDDADSGHDNWVQIAAAQVGGTLPAPVKLTLQNTTGGSVDYRNLYMATNAFSDPANFTHVIEGEARISGYGTITSLSSCSGGSYNAYAFSNSGLILWDLSSSLLQKTQGRWFRLLARFAGWTGTDIYVKPILRDATGLVTLWEGDEVRIGSSADTSSRIIDLGGIPLPVGGYQTSWGVMTLALSVRATGSAQVDIDFIQLTPLDSYRWVVQRGLSIVNNGMITDDNIEGLTHAGGSPIYSPKTGPLMVYPSKTQRIVILQDIGSSSNITQTLTVRAYIRERRLSV